MFQFHQTVIGLYYNVILFQKGACLCIVAHMFPFFFIAVHIQCRGGGGGGGGVMGWWGDNPQ